jgi:hypothetical protein
VRESERERERDMPGNCSDYIETTAFIQDSNAVFIEREREREIVSEDTWR